MESRSLLGIRGRKNQARSDQSQLGISGDHGNVNYLLQQHNITERHMCDMKRWGVGVILPQAIIYTIWHTRDYHEVERNQGRKPKLQTHIEI